MPNLTGDFESQWITTPRSTALGWSVGIVRQISKKQCATTSWTMKHLQHCCVASRQFSTLEAPEDLKKDAWALPSAMLVGGKDRYLDSPDSNLPDLQTGGEMNLRKRWTFSGVTRLPISEEEHWKCGNVAETKKKQNGQFETRWHCLRDCCHYSTITMTAVQKWHFPSSKSENAPRRVYEARNKLDETAFECWVTRLLKLHGMGSLERTQEINRWKRAANKKALTQNTSTLSHLQSQHQFYQLFHFELLHIWERLVIGVSQQPQTLKTWTFPH